MPWDWDTQHTRTHAHRLAPVSWLMHSYDHRSSLSPITLTRSHVTHSHKLALGNETKNMNMQ
jgi:hypothetical protein